MVHLNRVRAILSLDWSADFCVDLVAEPLALPSGVIWTALSIDYPGHSFSHLGVFFGLSFREAESVATKGSSRQRVQMVDCLIRILSTVA